MNGVGLSWVIAIGGGVLDPINGSEPAVETGVANKSGDLVPSLPLDQLSFPVGIDPFAFALSARSSSSAMDRMSDSRSSISSVAGWTGT